jgi:hypothetical protein
VRLFRDRYGHQLPDDDAGREDLWLLVTNVSLAAAEPQKKMRHVIDVWAPWMSAAECEAYVAHVWGLDIYERTRTARELGEQLRMTNAERERLKLWPFKPIDATDELIAERRRARRNERRRIKRGRSRAQFLAEAKSKLKPWEAAGMSRATWYRRRETSVGPTIVTKAESIPVSLSVVETQRGFQEVRELVSTENQPASGPRLVSSLPQPVSTKKRWTKPVILSDEPRDFSEFPLVEIAAA